MENLVNYNIDRCGYDVSEKQYKIWNVELDLAKELLRVCKKHDIQVFAWAGTLLGAIRHKGFIPWDDDMDFAMSRDNFEKLISVRDEFKEPYFLQYALNDRKYFLGYARLRNSNTTGLIAWNNSVDYNNGIYLDVYVVDGMPNNLKLFQLKKKLFNKLFNSYYKDGGFYKNDIISKLFHQYSKFKTYDELYEDYTKFMSSYTRKSKYLSTLTHDIDVIKKYKCKKEDLNSIEEANYEKIKFPTLSNYDEILKSMYGNYMEFPPAELRGKWHETIITFDPDTPYKTYMERKK